MQYACTVCTHSHTHMHIGHIRCDLRRRNIYIRLNWLIAISMRINSLSIKSHCALICEMVSLGVSVLAYNLKKLLRN